MKNEKMKNKQKKKLQVDFGLVLLVTGALANIPLWVGAFVSTEAGGSVSVWIQEYALPLLGSVSALAMGFTTAFGLVYVISALGRMQPTFERKMRGKDEYKTHTNYRFYGALLAIVLLLSISMALLSPLALMMVSGKSTLYSVLGSQWAGWWSFGRVAAADLALGAIALVHGVQLGAAPSASVSSVGASGAIQSKGSSIRSAKKQARTANEMRECEYRCGMSYRWPQGKGAHMKKHHPDLVIQKGIPVGVAYQTMDMENKQ